MTPLLRWVTAAFAPLRGRGDLVENVPPARPVEAVRSTLPAVPPARLRPRFRPGGTDSRASLAA
jgi:hypothetical protein